MNHRLISVAVGLSLLLPLGAQAVSGGVFEQHANARLQKFCTSPLAKRRPAACRRLPGWSGSSSSSSALGPILHPVIPPYQSPPRSSSSSLQAGFDSLPVETVRSRLLLLGTTTPVLAAVRFTSLTEPITAEALTVVLTDPVSSLESLRLYNSDGFFLGEASRDTSNPTNYRAPIQTGKLMIGKADDQSIYVRGILRSKDNGGVSGEVVDIDHVTLEATGDWSTSPYTISSTESLPASETARARITALATTNGGNWPLSSATNQLLWDFTVSGKTADGAAHLKLQNLAFTLSETNVSLTNVHLKAVDGDNYVSCTVTSSQVLCDSIPAGIGSVPDNGDLRLRVYGDVAVIGTPLLAYVQLSLGQAGTVTDPGTVTWTDGTSTFQWLDLDTPLGVGPRFIQ